MRLNSELLLTSRAANVTRSQAILS
jgi:hypothetical protein